MLNIQFNTRDVENWVAAAGNQLPFATMLALNRTAKLVKDGIREEMTHVYANPSRYTLNSLATLPAKKLDLKAVVFLKDQYAGGTPAINFIGPSIFTGGRHAKSHEVALRSAGILRGDQFAVPANGVATDQYGNIPRSKLRQMVLALSQRQATGNRRHTEFFVEGNPPIGVFTRQGRQVKPFLHFVRAPVYRKRLNFFETGQRIIDEHLSEEMMKALEYALRTAR